MSSFPGQPGELVPECHTILDFAEVKDDGGGGNDDNSFNTCKAPVKSPTITYQHSKGQSPNQQCQCIKEKQI